MRCAGLFQRAGSVVIIKAYMALWGYGFVDATEEVGVVVEEEALVTGFVAGLEGVEVGGEEGFDDARLVAVRQGTVGGAVAEPGVPSGDGLAVPAEGRAEVGGVTFGELAGYGALEAVPVYGPVAAYVGVEGAESQRVYVSLADGACRLEGVGGFKQI